MKLTANQHRNIANGMDRIKSSLTLSSKILEKSSGVNHSSFYSIKKNKNLSFTERLNCKITKPNEL